MTPIPDRQGGGQGGTWGAGEVSLFGETRNLPALSSGKPDQGGRLEDRFVAAGGPEFWADAAGDLAPSLSRLSSLRYVDQSPTVTVELTSAPVSGTALAYLGGRCGPP